MTTIFSKSDPRAFMLLAVHLGRVRSSLVEGCTAWQPTEGVISGTHLGWLLEEGLVTGPTGDGTWTTSTLTATGQSMLIVVHGIIPDTPPAATDPAPGPGASAELAEARSNALYDVRQGYITHSGTAWNSTSHNLPADELDWLLAHGYIALGAASASGHRTVELTALGERTLWEVAMVPPLAVVQVSVSLHGEVERVLSAAGAGKVRNMPVIGTSIPEVHIKSYRPDDEADSLNAAGRALLEHGGFDVRVGYDEYREMVLAVTGNPSAAPRQNVSATHITDVLHGPGPQ